MTHGMFALVQSGEAGDELDSLCFIYKTLTV